MGFALLACRKRGSAYRISLAAAAVASAMFARRASGATLNQYYFNVSIYSDPELTNLVSSVVINQSNPVVNVALGDYLSFGISDVLTNNPNPAAGDISGPGHNNLPQPANLGLFSMCYTITSSDSNASHLVPQMVPGKDRGTLPNGFVSYYSTAQVLVTSVMPTTDPGDVVPNSPSAGDVGMNFQLYAGSNPDPNPNSSDGIASLTAFTPTSGSAASFADSTPLFDDLSYQAVDDGSVTLTPAPFLGATGYWMNTSIGTGKQVSGYKFVQFGTNPDDVIVPLADLTVNVVPEPMTFGVAVLGLVGGLLVRRRGGCRSQNFK